MPPLRLPIRSKLALMFAGVCVVTFGLGGYLLSGTAQSALEEEILGRLRVQSQAVATELDGCLRLLERRTEDFASDGFIRDASERLQDGAGGTGGAGHAELREELRAHLLHNKLGLVRAFENLAVLDRGGRLLLSARGGMPSALPAALTRPERTAFAAILPPAGAEAEDRVRLAIATPLTSRAGGRPIGTLIAWVHPAVWVVESLRGGLGADPARPRELELELIEPGGRVMRVSPELTRPGGPRADSELLSGGFGVVLGDAPGKAEPAGRALSDSYSGSFPLATNGWTARVVLVGENPLAAVSGLQSRFLGFGVLITVAACLLFFVPMTFLTRPLKELASAARRIAGGDLEARVQLESDDELGALGSSFNSMAEALQERTGRLERGARALRARQAELSLERDRLQAVIASMRDGLVVLDADGEPVIQNAAAGPLLQEIAAGPGSLVPHHLCSNAGAESEQCHRCLFAPEVGPRSCVMDIGGGVFEVHATTLAPDAEGRRGRLLVSRDLSDRVAQDEGQIHQERLAVLGEVAAVMAHELNNPLAAISMYNQMLAGCGEGPAAEATQVIQRNVESCKRTIRDLLSYATPTTPEVQAVDVHATLEDAGAFLRSLGKRSGVELELELARETLEVRGDEVQVRQVFVNLIVNAIQATGQARGSAGGTVRVETRARGGQAQILVHDQGGGVPNELRERIFRPFFTTKSRGEGTGLGLPTARRIAEMHGGGLELLRSGPGGSTFRVRLRLVEEQRS